MTTAQTITASQVKDIKTAFATLKPQKVTLEGTRVMTVKEAVFVLAPTLERMRKRGFDITELVENLHEKGIPVKAATLAKYLNEFRRGKGRRQKAKQTHPRRHWRKEKTAWRIRRFSRADGNFGREAGTRWQT